MDIIPFDQLNKIGESLNNYNVINNSNQNNKQFDANQYFLLLSIYFYLKHHSHNVTAEILFEECKLGKLNINP